MTIESGAICTHALCDPRIGRKECSADEQDRSRPDAAPCFKGCAHVVARGKLPTRTVLTRIDRILLDRHR
eukprot:1263928-Rhodomonas_salina.4